MAFCYVVFYIYGLTIHKYHVDKIFVGGKVSDVPQLFACVNSEVIALLIPFEPLKKSSLLMKRKSPFFAGSIKLMDQLDALTENSQGDHINEDQHSKEEQRDADMSHHYDKHEKSCAKDESQQSYHNQGEERCKEIIEMGKKSLFLFLAVGTV